MEEIFYITPKIGDFPMNYLNSEDAARLKANVDRAKKGETFIFMDTIKTGDKTLYWQNMYSPIYNNRQKVIGVFVLLLMLQSRDFMNLKYRGWHTKMF